jgi:hypothetical protein
MVFATGHYAHPAELHSKVIVAPIIHHPRHAVALELFRRLIRERERRWRLRVGKTEPRHGRLVNCARRNASGLSGCAASA